VSLVVGAYVWSLSAFNYDATSVVGQCVAGATIVSELSVILNNCSINDGEEDLFCLSTRIGAMSSLEALTHGMRSRCPL